MLLGRCLSTFGFYTSFLITAPELVSSADYEWKALKSWAKQNFPPLNGCYQVFSNIGNRMTQEPSLLLTLCMLSISSTVTCVLFCIHRFLDLNWSCN